MPFEEINERVSTRADESPVTMRLVKRAAKTCCYVSVKMGMMASLKWSNGEAFAVALGNGDDEGKMRLVRKGKKAAGFQLRILKKRGLFDLGYIAKFGLDPTAKIGVEARVVDGESLEIDLPKFAEHPDLGDEDEETPGRRQNSTPTSSARASERAPNQEERRTAVSAAQPERPAAPTGQGSAPLTAVEHTGVRVSGGAKPMITHQGERLDLTPRQARVLAMLTKSLGSMLPTAVLIQKVGLNASAGAAQISDDYFALKEPLLDLGLKLTFMPKMGYTLAKG